MDHTQGLDAALASTGELVGPLHGVVFAVKDQYDTADLRTTSAADVDYANDRPPRDANFVVRLRAAGAIILAKANMGECEPPLLATCRCHTRALCLVRTPLSAGMPSCVSQTPRATRALALAA